MSSSDGLDRVAVVHADETFRAVVCETLASEGYAGVGFSDGKALLDGAQAESLSAVLVDVGVSEPFVFEVVEALRVLDPAIKIVLVTHIFSESAYKAPPRELHGADACIEPPELENGLIGLLDSLLGAAEIVIEAEPLLEENSRDQLERLAEIAVGDVLLEQRKWVGGSHAEREAALQQGLAEAKAVLARMLGHELEDRLVMDALGRVLAWKVGPSHES